METTKNTPATGCVEFASLFQNPLLEEPPTSGAPAEDRRRYQGMAAKAESLCQACPIQRECLYQAVVDHDVAGYVAGTSRRERMEIRRKLAITVKPEDFDTLAGVTGRHRQIDHDEVVRLRHANPHESLETIAQRLGCSLSTVKRHLRQARTSPRVTTLRAPQRPTMSQVMEIFRTGVRGPATSRRAA